MSRERARLLWGVAVWLASFAFFGAVFVLNVHSDLQPHVTSIITASEGKTVVPANFLYYLCVYVVALCSTQRSALYLAASIVLASAVTAKAIITCRFLDSYTQRTFQNSALSNAALLTLSSLMLVVFSLPTVGMEGGVSMYLGKLPPNNWHNSTTIFLMPFALSLFLKSYEQLEKPETWRIGVLTALCVLNVLAKPSFLFVFCVAYPLMLLCVAGWGKTFWTNLVPVVVGAALVVLQSYLIYQLSFGNLHREESKIVVAPLQAWHISSANIPASLLASLVFPLTYLAFYWRDIARNRLLQYSLLCYLIGLAVFCTFAEVGPRAKHGNFFWQLVACSYILFLVLLAEFVGKVRQLGLRSWPHRLILAAFSVHVIAGILYLSKMIIWRCY